MLTRIPQPLIGPRPGLLASLGAWTWPGMAPDGQHVGHVLLTHPPDRTSHDTPEAIEARMRLIAVSLGGLADARDPLPVLPGRLQIIGDQVLMRFHGSRYGLRLPTHPRWTALLTRSCEAIVMVGLDALPQSADATRVDTYLDTELTADRLLFGLARTT
ncbi:hypothetical protein [Streptantibioticus ferralitis]|uniref:Uncharacterized protein n=1 Tax=Streptantibioticus ferralitis TaxID=236510 RepID=A0ABT5Z0G3_9ACTN|nr:hypothetical protein [Streptantibioticus ferralitis]MDF2257307.1 hypothetical protein [Streptantibioticus ferralitis]